MQILSSENFYSINYSYYDEARVSRSSYLESVNDFIVNNFEKGPVLDIGCGDGIRSLYLKSKLKTEIIGWDSCVDMQDHSLQNGFTNFFHEDIVNPSKDSLARCAGYFGSIFCLWNVLGHITTDSDRQQAISNMANLISSKGLLFIDVNNRLNRNQYGIFAFIRNIFLNFLKAEKGVFSLPINNSQSRVYLTTKKELEFLLNSNGFIVEKLIFINYTTGRQEKSSTNGQILAICRKKL